MNNKKKGEKARATRSGVAVVPVLGPNIYYKAATPSKDLNALRLSDMPQEVLLHIFTFLFVEDLMVVGAVCRDFRAISKDHGLNNSFRPNVNVSFIGSCGAGKSTLVGHLMLLLGEAKQVDIKNAEQAAKDFETSVRPHAHLTFIASRRKIDRERGLTTDNNYLHALGSRHPAGFTLIDTPGHREYFRNTLRGFLQSDMAVWVVDRIHRSCEFYTRADSFLEAPLMIAGSNMRCAVVVVNKMDEREWSTRQYDEIKIQLAQILAKRRVDTKNVIVVPVSAATGWNLVHRTTVPSGEEKPDDIRLTYQGPTLWEAIIKLSNNVRPKALKRPFRLSVVKMWNTTLAPGERRRGLILGTVLQGGLKAGRTVRLSPAPGDMTKSPDITVWGIGHGKQKRSLAAPGCLVALLLPAGKLIPPMPKRGQDGSGWVAYDPKKEPDLLAATRCFVVQLMIFAGKSINPALLPTAGPNYGVGFSPIFHFVSGAFVGRVAAIHETIDVKTKKVIEQNPKTTSGVGRLYTMTIMAKCARIIEPYSKNSSFGRFFVTDNSILVGAGVVKYAVSANKTQAWRDLHLPLDSRFGPDRGLQRCTHFGYWGNPRPEIGYIVGHQRHVACAECFLTNVTANPSIIDNAYCPE